MNNKDIEAIVLSNEAQIHQIRQNIKNFISKVRAAVVDGSIELGDLYKHYEKMKPSIHKHCSDEMVDVSALSYALNRVVTPGVLKARSLYIQSNPEELGNIDGITKYRPKKRRRDAWVGRDGYRKVIAREGETEIIDILSMHLIIGIESEKIRQQLAGDDYLKNGIDSIVSQDNPDIKRQMLLEVADRLDVNYSDMKKLDDSLDNNMFHFLNDALDKDIGKMKVWFDSEFSRTDFSSKARLWREKIESMFPFNKDKPIHVISSNSHSIVSCLSDYTEANKDQIKDIAEHDEELKKFDLNSHSIYCLVHRLAEKNIEFLEAKRKYELEHGVIQIPDTNNTGIDVQIIDLEKIKPMDKRIKGERKPGYILNIDYAFGRQGTDIMREICQTWGRYINSISIFGKAGILCGDVDDLMLPDYFIPQIEGPLSYFPNMKNNLEAKDFEGLIEPDRVHTDAPMLTVPGTAIQNDHVLMYYMHLYNILGLEMEGIPYLESMEKAKMLKRIDVSR